MFVKRPRVLSAILFYPRGGSAHAARTFTAGLDRAGWDASIVSGSRSDADSEEDAGSFYEGLDVHPVDFTAALGSPDPLEHRPAPGEAPLHPSFEDRPGAPDRVFARLGDAELEAQVDAWALALDAAGAASADVLHLHHLTPLNEAASRAAPDVPVVGHIHGTELLMLEEISEGPPPGWTHAEAWAGRIRRWAEDCAALVVPSEEAANRASGLLGTDPERFCVIPNAVDVDRFRPRQVDRREHWRRHLSESPRGWRPGGPAGGVGYEAPDLESLSEGRVLLYVGRFTEVKRVPLLIRAFARAQKRFEGPASLVLLGGHPGEWEGEHPADVVAETGVGNVYLAGWHPQSALPEFMAASDAIVLPSVREQFGQALVEGMACGLPAIAVNRFGPAGIVEDGVTGRLVEPDDESALVDALVEAVNDVEAAKERGRLARRAAVERFSVQAAIGSLDELLRSVAEDPDAALCLTPSVSG